MFNFNLRAAIREVGGWRLYFRGNRNPVDVVEVYPVDALCPRHIWHGRDGAEFSAWLHA